MQEKALAAEDTLRRIKPAASFEDVILAGRVGPSFDGITSRVESRCCGITSRVESRCCGS